MRFWIRELVGYVLILLGLVGIYFALAMFANNNILGGAAFTVPAIFVFRGGIHLLKVAMAARIGLHAQAQLCRPRHRSTQAEKVNQESGLTFDW